MQHIIVGMSGGVDSSVSAALLLEQGYKVTGLFMKNWEEDDEDEYCAAAADLADAQNVCNILGIELKTINFSHEYWDRVFEHFLFEYKNGRTPNPDIACNKEIKFKEFLEWALHLGADKIATGHYAQIQHDKQLYKLCRGLDPNKDQTYFLHTLDQYALSKSVFPIGGMQKSDVRAKAEELGLPTHAKKDSTGICFIGERRFSDFLSTYLPAQKGKILDLQGSEIGQHQGAYYYTIGQRQGLGIGGEGDAWYVAAKDVKNNLLYAVQGHDHPALMQSQVKTEALHFIASSPPQLPFNCTAKTRYRQTDSPCTIVELTQEGATIEFTQPQWAITPGQSIVLYQGQECLGGGIIYA